MRHISKNFLCMIFVWMAAVAAISYGIYLECRNAEKLRICRETAPEYVFLQTEYQGDYRYDLVMDKNGLLRPAILSAEYTKEYSMDMLYDDWKLNWGRKNELIYHLKHPPKRVADGNGWMAGPNPDFGISDDYPQDSFKDIVVSGRIRQDVVTKYVDMATKIKWDTPLERDKKVSWDTDSNRIRYSILYQSGSGELQEYVLAEYREGEGYSRDDPAVHKILDWLYRIMPVEKKVEVEIKPGILFYRLDSWINWYIVIDQEGDVYQLSKYGRYERESEVDWMLKEWDSQEKQILGNVGRNKVRVYYSMMQEVNPRARRFTEGTRPMLFYKGYQEVSTEGKNYFQLMGGSGEEISLDVNAREIGYWMQSVLEPIRWKYGDDE